MAKETGRFVALKQLREPKPVEHINAAADDDRFDVPLPESAERETNRPPQPQNGRPRGKRSNPDYVLTSILINARNKDDATTIINAMKKSRQVDPERWPGGMPVTDFSDLMDKLLKQWLTDNADMRRKILQSLVR